MLNETLKLCKHLEYTCEIKRWENSKWPLLIDSFDSMSACKLGKYFKKLIRWESWMLGLISMDIISIQRGKENQNDLSCQYALTSVFEVLSICLQHMVSLIAATKNIHFILIIKK